MKDKKLYFNPDVFVVNGKRCANIVLLVDADNAGMISTSGVRAKYCGVPTSVLPMAAQENSGVSAVQAKGVRAKNKRS